MSLKGPHNFMIMALALSVKLPCDYQHDIIHHKKGKEAIGKGLEGRDQHTC